MQVIQAPNPILRMHTKPIKKVTPALLQSIKEMIKLTKSFKDPEGVGLASNQVGQDGRYFIVKSGEKFLIVINPKILSKSKATKEYLEGCLSIPNYWGITKRHLNIKVSYLDETGKNITKLIKGQLAWFFQHEIDHLDGKLYVDHVLEQKGKFYKVVGKDKAGADIFEEVNLP